MARDDFDFGMPFPCLADRYDTSGVASGHYFHQDLYVAQAIHAARPERHVDVGSRVDGFVAHVAAFRQIEVCDIRQLPGTSKNITFRQRDISEPAPEFDAYTDSLSCLHTLEHIGLGRYGDPIAYDGYRAAWHQLHRMVKPGGTLYFSVPVGRHQRIEFDAHRVFSLPYLLKEMIGPLYAVADLAYVDDQGQLHTGVETDSSAAAESFNLNYGCAIFTLTKL